MKLRHQLEYAPVWLLVHFIGILPRPLARAAGIVLAYKMYFLLPRLRRVGMRNLELAFPEKAKSERKKTICITAMRGATHLTSESIVAKHAVATSMQAMPRSAVLPLAAGAWLVIAVRPAATSLLPPFLRCGTSSRLAEVHAAAAARPGRPVWQRKSVASPHPWPTL